MTMMERDTDQFQNDDIREKIERRAYEVYESRGSQDGHDLEDWLRAENEVRAQMQRPHVKSVKTQNSEQLLGPSSVKRSSERRAS